MKKFLPQFLSLFFVWTSFAQETNTIKFLRFDDCLELAMQNNLSLQSALLEEKIAHTQYKASYGQILPTISASGDNRYSWGKEIDNTTNLFVNTQLKTYEGSVNANFNLFSGFRVLNSIRAMRQEREISRENIELTKNEITIDLAQRYITILYLQEIIEANLAQIRSSEKQIELAQLKFDNGTISESEVFKIKAQKANEELSMLTNQNSLTDNLISIKQLMNLPIETEIALSEPELDFRMLENLENRQYELTKQAVTLHPAYKMSAFGEQRARTELSIARGLRFPLLNMRIQHRSNYSDNDEETFRMQIKENTATSLRFGLEIPIFNQFETWSEVQTAKLEWKQAQIFTKLEQNRLSKEVMKSITDTRTSIKKRDASGLAYEFSQKSLEADDLKFQLGKININEWSLTKMNFNKAQAELIQARYELLFNNALIKFYLGESFTL